MKKDPLPGILKNFQYKKPTNLVWIIIGIAVLAALLYFGYKYFIEDATGKDRV